MSGIRVVVVGGGLAGLAAAVRLAAGGARVTLLEARPRLGGATYSFRRDSLSVDNGQHVLLRCYTEHRAFLRAIGSEHLVEFQDRFDVPVLAADGRRARLHRAKALPAPLHLSSCLARYSILSPAERLRIVTAALRLKALDVDDARLDDTSFGAWLRAHGQSEASMSALWDLLIVAALNTRCDDASLQPAVKVFQTALLTRAQSADIGMPLVPLSALHAEPAAKALRELGADIFPRTKATAIEVDDGALTVRADAGCFPADVVIVATGHTEAAEILPDGATPRTQRLRELGSAPIINAHFVFDRVVTDLPFAAAVGSPVQWTFDRSRIAGVDGPRQYLAVSLSAAEDLIDLPSAAVRERLLPEFVRLFGRASDARLEDFFVTRERRATFRQGPGSRSLRPPAATDIPGLYLAGAWTDTGWPDTMEGAVRSGNEAARRALEHRPAPALAREP
jgi:squalene-associated FAD-dependent desaturase